LKILENGLLQQAARGEAPLLRNLKLQLVVAPLDIQQAEKKKSAD
jgi:hypothetical protein